MTKHFLGTLMVAPFVSQDLKMFLAELDTTDLKLMHDLMEAGKVTLEAKLA